MEIIVVGNVTGNYTSGDTNCGVVKLNLWQVTGDDVVVVYHETILGSGHEWVIEFGPAWQWSTFYAWQLVFRNKFRTSLVCLVQI